MYFEFDNPKCDFESENPFRIVQSRIYVYVLDCAIWNVFLNLKDHSRLYNVKYIFVFLIVQFKL